MNEENKCGHDACRRKKEAGSDYCSECVQLPALECNFCDGGLPQNKEMRELADKVQQRMKKPWWKFW